MHIITKSIIQKDKECFVCMKKNNLHLHHIMFGRNRKIKGKELEKKYFEIAKERIENVSNSK